MVLRHLFFSILYLVIHWSGLSQVRQGAIDLSTYDFNTSPPVFLKGEWRYFPQELHTRATDTTAAKGTFIAIPKRWNEVGYDGFGYGTYMLQVVKPTNEALVLKIPDVLSAFKLYINGELIDSVGSVGASAETSVPSRKTRYISISPDLGDTLSLCIQVSNFTHNLGGIGSIPALGGIERTQKRKLYEDTYDVFLFGCLFMGGLFFLGLFSSGTREKMALHFALFCFMYAYRVIGWGNYLLHDIIDIPYHLAIRLEYATLYMAVFFFANYLKSLFPKDVPHRIVNFFIYISLVFAASTLLPVHIFTSLISYFLWILMAVMVVVGVVFVRAAINKRKGAQLALYSTFGIFIVFILKLLVFFRIISDFPFVSIIGEISFFFFQSIILSRYFTDSWRKAKNDAVRLAQSKADFLSVMSHEIRTPLNALIGTTYHMWDSNPRLDQKEDLTNLKNASENLLNLVNNILDFNKIEQGKLELEMTTVKLKAFVESQIKVFESNARNKNIYLKFHCDEKLPESVQMDKGRVGQIISNLVGNAIKFTKEGGVTVNVIHGGNDGKKTIVRFDIIDTGIGIDENDVVRIFQSFEQANANVFDDYGGSGLGLAITKMLLEKMGSDITVKSHLNNGSVFSFSLKLLAVTNEKLEDAPNKVLSLKGIKILLVDDNAMNIMIAKRFLEKWQIEVDVAENGKVAFDKASADIEAYDLILMDLQMPVMDGYESSEAIRKAGYNRPIIALTASSITETELKNQKGNMNDFVTKPYNPTDLFHKIEKNLAAFK
jgi:signal transduction histidine kinase/ActR/RegA family two-component response regulator